METVFLVISWALIAVGSVAVMIGGIGVLRFPDVYTRMHAASVTDTAGAGLLLAGLMIYEGPTLIAVKMGFMLVFLFFTSPTSAFCLAHAAMTSGIEPVLHDPGEDTAGSAEGGRS